MQERLVLNEITVQYKPRYNTCQDTITSSEKAYQHAIRFFNEDTLQMQEQFVVLYLNQSNRVIGGYTHSFGGITSTIADIRIIFSIALKVLATGIILCHNHPSGRIIPSRADKELTKKFKEAGKVMDITIVDHLIVSYAKEFYSFADEGLLS